MSADVRIHETPEATSAAVAGEVVRCGVEALGRAATFSIALAGGRTPQGVYELLSSMHAGALDWSRVEFFFGDERCVPPDDPASNYGMARRTLLEPLGIAGTRIHRMAGESADLNEAAAAYELDIAAVLGGVRPGPPPKLDLVLLGMGADGHTASLFPQTAALREKRRWVVANEVPQLQTRRITMTAVLINAARRVLFIVTGREKAAALRDVLHGPPDAQRLPSRLIRPASGGLSWFCDRGAASLLPGQPGP